MIIYGAQSEFFIHLYNIYRFDRPDRPTSRERFDAKIRDIGEFIVMRERGFIGSSWSYKCFDFSVRSCALRNGQFVRSSVFIARELSAKVSK